MIDISIIIINYNTFQLTCRCIKSIIENTHGLTYEIILVDNASTECDVDEFKKLFPQINLIKSQENLGFAKGNNLGIQYATGKYILLLNSDTELIENSILICYNEFLEQKNIAILTCKLCYPNGEIQHNCQSFPSVINTLIEKTRFHKLLSKEKRARLIQGFYWDYDIFGYPDWIWGTFFMFKKSSLDLLPQKKLNEDFFMYIEDMQWCWDFKKTGKAIAYTPKTKIIHLGGGSMASFNDLIIKNYVSFLDKNYGSIQKRLIQSMTL